MEAFDALLAMRVKSWTTSDIGGLNSGSCCRSFRLVVCLSSCKGDDRSTISLFYLNAAANNVSKTRQCLFRTLSLNGRIYHLCYGINIIELRSGPSHQMLFSPWTWAAIPFHVKHCWIGWIRNYLQEKWMCHVSMQNGFFVVYVKCYLS